MPTCQVWGIPRHFVIASNLIKVFHANLATTQNLLITSLGTLLPTHTHTEKVLVALSDSFSCTMVKCDNVGNRDHRTYEKRVLCQVCQTKGMAYENEVK